VRGPVPRRLPVDRRVERPLRARAQQEHGAEGHDAIRDEQTQPDPPEGGEVGTDPGRGLRALLDAEPDITVVDDALDAGADGFLLKRATPEQLIDGIRTVVGGDALLAPAVTGRLLASYASRRPPDRDRLRHAAHLTDRAAEILRALADGFSNAEIARHVWLSPETVKTHVKSVLAKLGGRDRTQAVSWAYRTGYVGADQRRPEGGERVP
jgi:DNA-binding NarL/FixJ family response regulator